MIAFKPVTGACGADVYGIDLSEPLADATVDEIRNGLNQFEVLFFREQTILTVDQHMALAENFGEPEPTPFRSVAGERSDLLVLDQTNPKGSDAANFHADNTFRQEPPIGAILQAQIVPERGGDTCFASMTTAYEGLSRPLQEFLEGLEAYHSYAQMMERLARKGTAMPGLNPGDHPPVKHPVVARHPATGRKTLFVNYNWTTHIDGLTLDESSAILNFLYGHIKNPSFQSRLRWNKGDIVFWDNRAVQHNAVADYNERRLIHRVSLLPKETRTERTRSQVEESAAAAE
jgi:taurine dioxygenase